MKINEDVERLKFRKPRFHEQSIFKIQFKKIEALKNQISRNQRIIGFQIFKMNSKQ